MKRQKSLLLILSAIIWSSGAKVGFGQTEVHMHRLLGTSFAEPEADGVWKITDSVRYTYPGFENTFEPASISRDHTIAEPYIPISQPDLPLFETGFYSGTGNYLFTPPSNISYDSSFSYASVYGTLDQWEQVSTHKRAYQVGKLTYDAHYFPEPNPFDSIVTMYTYNEDEQLEYLYYVSLNHYSNAIDTVSSYLFSYAEGKLESILSKGINNYDGALDTFWIKQFSYYPNGMPKSETEYTFYNGNAANAHKQYLYTYQAENKLSLIENQRQADGAWYTIITEQFEYENGLPSYYLKQERSIDTTDGISFTDWDTTYQIFYYHTDQILDSVSAQQTDYTNNLSSWYKEEYQYINGLITEYTYLDYKSFIYLIQYTYIYNDLNQLIQKHSETSDDVYQAYNKSDTYFSYDSFGNKVTAEFWSGYSTIDLDHATTSPEYKRRYTYTTQDIAGTADGNLFLHAYPSPAENSVDVFIGADGSLSNKLSLTIYTLSGAKVYFQEVDASNSMTMTIDCSRWQSGMYMAVVRQGNAQAFQKIIVK